MMNAELIEQIESTPDTVITLTTGNNIIVKESVDEVESLVVAYRAKILNDKSERRTSAKIRE